MTTTKKKAIQTRKIEKELEFTLTQEEIAEKGKQAAKYAQEQGEMERQFDKVKKEWTGKINKLEIAVSNELSVIRSGKELRMVECTEEKNFEKKTVRYIWKGKTMLERDMTLNETQMAMETTIKTRKPSEKKPEQLKATVKEHVEAKTGKKVNGKGEEIAEVIKQETSAKTKHSSVDGAVN